MARGLSSSPRGTAIAAHPYASRSPSGRTMFSSTPRVLLAVLLASLLGCSTPSGPRYCGPNHATAPTDASQPAYYFPQAARR